MTKQRRRQRKTVRPENRPLPDRALRKSHRLPGLMRLNQLPDQQRRDFVGNLGGQIGNRRLGRYLQRSGIEPINWQSGLLAGNTTLDSVYAGEQFLKKGSSDAGAVRLLQLGLTSLNPQYDLGSTGLQGVDGDFGPLTEQAVRAFQGESGLATDGIVGAQTIQALDRRLGQTITQMAADGGDPLSQEPDRPDEKSRQPIRQAERNFGPADERHDGDEPANKRFASNNFVRVFEWDTPSGSPSSEVKLTTKPWQHVTKLGSWGQTTSNIELHIATVPGKDGRFRPIIDSTDLIAEIKLKEAAAFKEIKAFKPLYDEFKGSFYSGDEYHFSLAMATEAMTGSSTHPYSDFGTVDGVLFHELLHALIAKKTAVRGLKRTMKGISQLVADSRDGIFDQVMAVVDESWHDFRGQDPDSGDSHLEIYRQEALWYLRAYEKSVGLGL